MKWSRAGNTLARAFVLALVVIATVGYLSLNNLKEMKTSHYSSLKRGQIIDQIDRLLYTVKDAETNSRAYIITGSERFLGAFNKAPQEIAEDRSYLDLLLSAEPDVHSQLAVIDTLVAKKLAVMQSRVQTMRTRGFEEARRLYLTPSSVILMDEIADRVRDIEEQERRSQREDDKQLEVWSAKDYAYDALLAGLTTLVVILFFIAASRQMELRAKSDKALVASEDRFRLLIENSLDGIFVTDLKGTIEYANPAGRNLLGYTDQELLGRDAITYVHAEDADAVRRSNAILASGAQGAVTADFRIAHKEGSFRWIEARGQRIRYNDREAILSNYRDVTDRKVAEKKLLESEEQYRDASERLRWLSNRLLTIQETERRNLALELHDEIGQLLTAVQMNIETAKRSDESTESIASLNESSKLISTLLDQIRTISLELRPSVLDQFGLVSALRWYVDQQSRRGNIKAEFKTDLHEERFDPELETVCFRLVQESLTNVLRHAHAQCVKVDLRARNSGLLVEVTDDGTGFDPSNLQRLPHGEQGLGLIGMRERVSLIGGTFEIVSSPGKGTVIHATLPSRSETTSVTTI